MNYADQQKYLARSIGWYICSCQLWDIADWGVTWLLYLEYCITYEPSVIAKLMRNLDVRTWGNSLKLLVMCLDVRKYSFCNRIVKVWNLLPDSVINSNSINSFKCNIDKHFRQHEVFFDFEASLWSLLVVLWESDFVCAMHVTLLCVYVMLMYYTCILLTSVCSSVDVDIEARLASINTLRYVHVHTCRLLNMYRSQDMHS